MRRRLLLAAPAALLAAPSIVRAQERVLNLYSSRHYDTDRALYDGFTAATGTRVRLIEGDADQLLARIQAEGANSPADVLIAVDAAPLQRALEAGILVPGWGVVRRLPPRPGADVRQAPRPAAGPAAV